jgi:lipoprotein signal peptidase
MQQLLTLNDQKGRLTIKKRFWVIVASFVFLFQTVTFTIRHFGGFYICNKGVSFGIIIPNGLVIIILILLSIIFLFLHINLNNIQPLTALGIVGIFTGAMSNYLDRLLYCCVIDYIPLPFLTGLFFNLADLVIFCGASLLFYSLLGRGLKEYC